jgi:hypothetical protein
VSSHQLDVPSSVDEPANLAGPCARWDSNGIKVMMPFVFSVLILMDGPVNIY